MIAFIEEYWLGFLFGICVSALTAGVKYISTRKKKKVEEQALIKDGLLAILHDRLYQCCNFHIRNGEIADEDLKNVEYIYKSYHALGGNGTGTELYKRTQKLPLKK